MRIFDSSEDQIDDSLTCEQALRIAKRRILHDKVGYQFDLDKAKERHVNHVHKWWCFKWMPCWRLKDRIAELETDVEECVQALHMMDKGDYTKAVQYYAKLIGREVFMMTSLDNEQEVEFNQELSDLRLVQTRLAQHSST